MAKAYFEGSGWAFRLRVNKQDIYRSGFSTEAAAKRAMAELSSLAWKRCPVLAEQTILLNNIDLDGKMTS